MPSLDAQRLWDKYEKHYSKCKILEDSAFDLKFFSAKWHGFVNWDMYSCNMGTKRSFFMEWWKVIVKVDDREKISWREQQMSLKTWQKALMQSELRSKLYLYMAKQSNAQWNTLTSAKKSKHQCTRVHTDKCTDTHTHIHTYTRVHTSSIINLHPPSENVFAYSVLTSLDAL